MKCLLRLALFAGLALAGAASAHAEGAFGLFYERCTGCCAGCPRPWNAFSDGSAPSTYGRDNGCAQMPCYPYQGPGDPNAGMYACGDPNVGCGGNGPYVHWTHHLKHKLHAICGHCHHCDKPGCGDDDIGIGFDGGYDTGSDAGLFPTSSCGPNGCAPAWSAPPGGYPASHQVGYTGPYTGQSVPVQYTPQYPTHVPGYGYPVQAALRGPSGY